MSGDRNHATIRCIGCGAAVPDIEGPTHRYIGASPGCWKIYGDVLAREYGELRNPDYHRITVDAYAAQHPGTESRQSIQSVGAHLIALHLVFVDRLAPTLVTKRMGAMVDRGPEFRWLTPPSFVDTRSVHSVLTASSAADHERAVQEWALSVWSAWASHHDTVRDWASGFNA